MEMIAGIPKDELEAHNAKVREMKLRAFDMALSVARMTPEELKNTGYGGAGHVILLEAKAIEKLTIALERKYPA